MGVFVLRKAKLFSPEGKLYKTKLFLFLFLIEYLVNAVEIINPDYSRPCDKVFEPIFVDKLEKERL